MFYRRGFIKSPYCLCFVLRKNWKRLCLASKLHFHNCPVTRACLKDLKGAEKSTIFQLGEQRKPQRLSLWPVGLSPPSPLVAFRIQWKKFLSLTSINKRHEISALPLSCSGPRECHSFWAFCPSLSTGKHNNPTLPAPWLFFNMLLLHFHLHSQ